MGRHGSGEGTEAWLCVCVCPVRKEKEASNEAVNRIGALWVFNLDERKRRKAPNLTRRQKKEETETGKQPEEACQPQRKAAPNSENGKTQAQTPKQANKTFQMLKSATPSLRGQGAGGGSGSAAWDIINISISQ